MKRSTPGWTERGFTRHLDARFGHANASAGHGAARANTDAAFASRIDAVFAKAWQALMDSQGMDRGWAIKCAKALAADGQNDAVRTLAKTYEKRGAEMEGAPRDETVARILATIGE